MSIYNEIAEELGELITKKNEAYGSSFAKAGEFLKLLYPHGLSVDEFETALLLVRIFDKQMRLATDADAFGESPFLDIAGYGILGVSLHHARKEIKAHPGHGLKQLVGIWVERTAHARCSFCYGPLGPNHELQLLVEHEGVDMTVAFCSQLHKDAGQSAFAKLDGAPR